jgi:hypothetical protein
MSRSVGPQRPLAHLAVVTPWLRRRRGDRSDGGAFRQFDAPFLQWTKRRRPARSDLCATPRVNSRCREETGAASACSALAAAVRAHRPALGCRAAPAARTLPQRLRSGGSGTDRRVRPPQISHFKTSTLNTRDNNSAHGTDDGARAGGAVAGDPGFCPRTRINSARSLFTSGFASGWVLSGNSPPPLRMRRTLGRPGGGRATQRARGSPKMS